MSDKVTNRDREDMAKFDPQKAVNAQFCFSAIKKNVRKSLDTSTKKILVQDSDGSSDDENKENVRRKISFLPSAENNTSSSFLCDISNISEDNERNSHSSSINISHLNKQFKKNQYVDGECKRPDDKGLPDISDTTPFLENDESKTDS